MSEAPPRLRTSTPTRSPGAGGQLRNLRDFTVQIRRAPDDEKTIAGT